MIYNVLTLLPDTQSRKYQWSVGGKPVVLPVSRPRIYGTTIAWSDMVTTMKNQNITESESRQQKIQHVLSNQIWESVCIYTYAHWSHTHMHNKDDKIIK